MRQGINRPKKRYLKGLFAGFFIIFCFCPIFLNAQSYFARFTSIFSLVSGKLKASFSYSPIIAVPGMQIRFIDTSKGSPESWLWEFGDGSLSYEKSPSHYYENSGIYSVSLTVSKSGSSSKATRRIKVYAIKSSSSSNNSGSQELTASFTYSPSSPYMGQTVQFTDNSSGSPTSWSWKFGDGGTSTQKNPTHAYSAAGSFNVTLTISNGTSSNSMTQTITVKSSVAANFNYSPVYPTVGQEVQFIDDSQGSPTSWAWDFGDGGNSTSKNPTHIYSKAGTFNVKLTVSDGSNSNTANKSISIYSSSSNVITAASCELADVQSAIAMADVGDTVIVPSGSAVWSSNLVIKRGIILKGAGIDKTIITCNYSGSGTNWESSRFLVSYVPESPGADQPFRLSGFTFDLNNKDTGGLLLRNTTNYHQTKIRIDHTKWENVIGNFTRHIIHIYGYFYGVADNNYIDTPGLMRFEALDTTTWANETFDFGTADNFYMEDNFFRFYNSGCFYLEAAGRLALRYNAIKLDALVGEDGMYCAVVPVHGNQANAWSGAMGFEAYGNEIYATYDNRLVDMRAGKTLFYNNTITQPRSSTMICAREEEYDSGNPPARSPISGQPQHVSDSYIFNNYRNGVLKITDFPYTGSQLYYGDEGCYVPTEDIHFFRHNTSFNGSSGVGVGTLSQRPSSCSKEGVAWWATDENKLYRWKNGKWELYYTPFPYPHPLRAILSD